MHIDNTNTRMSCKTVIVNIYLFVRLYSTHITSKDRIYA